MQWPPWPFSNSNASKTAEEKAEQRARSVPASQWSAPVIPFTWDYYLQPATIIPTIVITSTIFTGRYMYVQYLKRIPGALKISDAFWHKRSVFGRVTSVGDGDGFRLFHTPGGRMAGWGLLPWRKVPTGKALKDKTISIRLSGVDAPEGAHFGRPAQPGGPEAHEWLLKYILNRRVRAYVLKRDQYDRAVARVYVWKGIFRRDIGFEMLKRGLATVYEAKTGAEFGGKEVEEKYRSMESWAKKKRKGIWAMARKDANWETPREFKARGKDTTGQS